MHRISNLQGSVCRDMNDCNMSVSPILIVGLSAICFSSSSPCSKLEMSLLPMHWLHVMRQIHTAPRNLF